VSEEATTAATDTGDGTTTTAATDTGGETITMSKAEVDALKRTVAEARKAERKAEAAAARAAEEDAKRKGDYEAASKAAEERAAKAEERLTQIERQSRVTAAAAREKFRDPADAIALLPADVLDDESKLTAALKQLKKDKPYLAAEEPRRTGGSIDTADRQGAHSMDALIRRAAGRG
jgi:hypothetical protein